MNRRAFLIRSCCLAAAGGVLLKGVRPASGQARAFNPTRFSVEVQGQGPDVILIPGLTSGRSVWDPAVAAVPGYRYHRLQVSGFGGEPARGNADGPMLQPLVEEIARYIRSARLRQPVIVGHSMGGTIGMMLAARHPDLVGRLMVVDMLPQPAGLFGSSGGWLARMASGLGGMMSDPYGRQMMSSVIGAFSPPAASGIDSDPMVVAQAMHDLGVTDLTAELPRIGAPMVVVYAVGSEAERAATRERFARAYAGARRARLVPIEPCSHMVMRDQPAAFARILGQFLRV